MAYIGGAPEDSCTYFVGAEVDGDARNNRFALCHLPAREYVVCGFEAENFEKLVTVALNKAMKYGGAWLENHGLAMDAYSPEIYYDSLPEANYMELWMPADKKKRGRRQIKSPAPLFCGTGFLRL